ncbi:DNA topoisomerase 2 [Polyrhizophydium stewartii]|uniref:DNA topoisomerase 2 n=1 Tax=Polyrhizophydium stewartii TaxID=2732419 RepID=A0ABR4NBY6_9FUNG|nr:DNA topoisomerase 2 [Polyrhizophydium stewartii]
MSSGSDFGDDYDGSGDEYSPVKVSKPKKAPAAAASKPAKAAKAAKSTAAAAAPKPKKEPVSAAAAAPASDVEMADASRSSTAVSSPVVSKKQLKDKSIEEIYQKKSQIEHILIRPDTYIGSTESISTPLWIFENDRMVYRAVSYVPGLYKIFDEIIVNAADNKVRDPSMDTIKVTIDRENNTISVYNNGRGIPVQIHAKEKVYVPELIFGHLLTSSNYDDGEKKVTGGRNGYGAKLCNIFSTEFIVETADSSTSQKFKQVFNDNMSKKSTPKITPNPKGEDYTKITFKPDLAKFKMTTIDDDLFALMQKRVYDLAGCVRGVKVFLNNTRIKIKDFKEYVGLYLSGGANGENGELGPKPQIVYERVNERWEVAFTPSEGQFTQVSFVNSICTSKGGTHVNSVADQVVTALTEAVKKKDKKAAPLKPFQAKSHMWVFVNCQIENPTFDSQTKENMTLRASAFGSKCPISEEFMKKVLKSGVVDSILSFSRFKQDQLLKKTDGRGKQTRISGITKLDDANNAGTRHSSDCTLILTEGDSAKALAISGLSVIGRDNFGVFPLRGKLLNVREATHSQVIDNAEINAIKQIMGLQHGKVYEEISSLRYGHLMIMTDQDHDGSHIKGLIINFIDYFWPSLLRVPGFLLEFITPIVKATKGKDRNKREISFFTIPEYERWKEDHMHERGWVIKYYKGLGTSTAEDAKKYFSDMNKHLKPFRAADDESRGLIDMAFNKKKADNRKEWIAQFQACAGNLVDPGTFMDHSVPEISLPDFVNRELILFSMADNVRSIPSGIDGFKPGQRKILFATFKRNLKVEIKVAQLAGYIAEHSAYHHGEQNLHSTIVNMGQNFVGANNLTLLEPRGQFGTRLQGGKDAASARYIFTILSPLARAVFPAADDPLLEYLVEDGQSIEPKWYIPVLPMLLVNGADGIGTGWSTSIPNFNPRDLVECLHCLMDGREMPELHPWYRGFRGTITRESADRYRVTGVINKLDDTTVEITELPIGTWTQTYKELLEAWLTGTEKQPAWIRDYKEYHTVARTHFVVTLSEDALAAAEAEGLEKKFRLSTTISMSNLVCFDSEGRIKKYSSVHDIVRDFYDLRLTFYQKRKDYLLDQLSREHDRLSNRVRFVTEIIEGTLRVQNRKRADLLEELRKRKYRPFPKKQTGVVVAGGDADPEADADADAGEGDDNDGEIKTEGAAASASKAGADHGYDYLLSMPIWSITWEKVQELIREMKAKEEELTQLTRRSVSELWRADLDAFLAQWTVYEEALARTDAEKPAGAGKVGGARKGGRGGKKAAAGTVAALVKKAARKVKNEDGDDDDIDDDDDDGDDDFVPVKKERKTAASASASAASAAPAVKAASAKAKATLDAFVKREGASSSVPAKRPSPTADAESAASVAAAAAEAAGDGSKPVAMRKLAPAKKAVEPTAALKQLAKTTKPAAIKRTIKIDSDDDDVVGGKNSSANTSAISIASSTDVVMASPAKRTKTAASAEKAKAKPAAKKPAAKPAKIESDDDDDADSGGGGGPADTSMSTDDIDADSIMVDVPKAKPKPKAKSPAEAKPKAAPAAKAKAVSKRIMTSSEDDDDDDDDDDGDFGGNDSGSAFSDGGDDDDDGGGKTGKSKSKPVAKAKAKSPARGAPASATVAKPKAAAKRVSTGSTASAGKAAAAKTAAKPKTAAKASRAVIDSDSDAASALDVSDDDDDDDGSDAAAPAAAAKSKAAAGSGRTARAATKKVASYRIEIEDSESEYSDGE